MRVLLLAVGKDAIPRGLADISSFLQQRGISTGISNLRDRLGAIENWECDPDVIGISSYTTSAPLAEELCPRIRKRWPKAKIVLGGRHFCADTLGSDAGKTWLKLADHVVFGEGEHAMLAIVEGKSPEQITRGRELSEAEFRALPMPSMRFVKRHLSGDRGFILARGCPYHCTYCGSDRRKVIRKEPEIAVDYLKQYGGDDPRAVFIQDDVFTSNRRWLQQFVAAYKRQKLRVKIDCFIHGRTFSQDLLELLVACNVRRLSLGAESGSDRILQAIGKHTTVDDYRRIDRLVKTKGKGAVLHCLWMIGNAGETDSDMQATVRLAREIGMDQPWVSYAIPFPGTRFWHQAKTMGTITTWDFSRWNNRTVVFVPHGCRKEAMQRYRAEIVN